MLGSIGVFIYLFVLIYIDYIKAVEINRFLDFDVQTITAADYTIEFHLAKKQYDWFKAHYYHKRNPMSELA